jgi:hypothetical protein
MGKPILEKIQEGFKTPPQSITNLDEIRKSVLDVVEAERSQFQPDPEPEEETNNSINITSKDVVRAFHRNEIGDAWLFINHHTDKLIYDTQAGRWYVWDIHYWKSDDLNEALMGVQKVVMYYEQEYEKQCWLALQEVKKEGK